ncbi:MAG: type II secretion system F family protein, partial [Planctomycetaceae bacterium]
GSKRVPTRYLTVFYNQLADLLKSGVPLLRSLQLLEDQTSNPVLRSVVQDVREQVADGTRLNDAMRRHPKSFNFLSISMVKAGEEGGFLEEVLSRIAVFNEHQEELRGRVTGAMVYPMFLMLVKHRNPTQHLLQKSTLLTSLHHADRQEIETLR